MTTVAQARKGTIGMKHISDLQVVLAYLVYREKIEAEPPKAVYGMEPPTEPEVWPYTILAGVTGQPEKVCFRAMERAEARGLIDCGVSLRTGWATDKGKDLVRQRCTEKGVPIPPELALASQRT